MSMSMNGVHGQVFSKEGTFDPVQVLPKEIFKNEILKYLTMRDLIIACGLVNKEWRELARNFVLKEVARNFLLKEVARNFVLKEVVFLGPEVWKKYVDLPSHGLSVDDAPLLEERTIIRNLMTLSSLDIRGDAGITILTIPKNLTLKVLIEKIAEFPKEGRPVDLQGYLTPFVMQNLTKLVVEKSYTIAISNDILKGTTKFLTDDEQKGIVQQAKCRLPKAIEITALLFLTYISTGKCLYPSDNDSTTISTRCVDQIFSQDGTLWESGYEVPALVKTFYHVQVCGPDFASKQFSSGFCSIIMGGSGFDKIGIGVVRDL